jgi:hypothetical protein
MRNAGLAGVSRRKGTVTTVGDGARQAPDTPVVPIYKYAASLAAWIQPFIQYFARAADLTQNRLREKCYHEPLAPSDG